MVTVSVTAMPRKNNWPAARALGFWPEMNQNVWRICSSVTMRKMMYMATPMASSSHQGMSTKLSKGPIRRDCPVGSRRALFQFCIAWPRLRWSAFVWRHGAGVL